MSTPERLAYWYFRPNGFLTTENFVVHPDRGANQRTDGDLLAVRFPHRQELSMDDDPIVAESAHALNVVIAEVKAGLCSLNGPWTDPASANLIRVVQSVGCVSRADEEQASTALYESGYWASDDALLRLFAIGDRVNTGLQVPEAPQVTWAHIIDFCVRRFHEYRNAKRSVGQWAPDGRDLQRAALSQTPDTAVRCAFGLIRRRQGRRPR